MWKLTKVRADKTAKRRAVEQALAKHPAGRKRLTGGHVRVVR